MDKNPCKLKEYIVHLILIISNPCAAVTAGKLGFFSSGRKITSGGVKCVTSEFANILLHMVEITVEGCYLLRKHHVSSPILIIAADVRSFEQFCLRVDSCDQWKRHCMKRPTLIDVEIWCC